MLKKISSIEAKNFQENNVNILDRTLLQCNLKKKWQDLEDLLENEPLLSYSYKSTENSFAFSVLVFEKLVGVLKDNSVPEKTKNILIHFMKDDLDLMSERQRQKFSTVLGEEFYNSSDWVVAYSSAEIIGRGGDNHSYEILHTLSLKGAEELRMFIPYGFETLIKHSKSDDVSGKSYENLLSMSNSGLENVEREANLSLSRLKKNSLM